MDPVRDDFVPYPSEYVWQPPPKFQDRRWLHLALLLATIATTTIAGTGHYLSFATDFGQHDVALSSSQLLVRGLWYSGTILGILGCHELGHYFACRYYNVDASLPFFLPMLLVPTGTFGAFIRIREPIPSKRMLFDIGIAGPLAGFIVAVPAMFFGLWMSTVTTFPSDVEGWTLGEPLLFKLGSWLMFGSQPDSLTINLHPVAFGAWFGLIATALNLLPVGQLDGGHISYAVLGRKSSNVTLATAAVALGLIYYSQMWIVWTTLMLVMLFVFGRHHPRTFDEAVPLDSGRKKLAIFAAVMLVLCFTPAPLTPIVNGGPHKPQDQQVLAGQTAVRQSTLSGSTSTTTRLASSGRDASASASASRIRLR